MKAAIADATNAVAYAAFRAYLRACKWYADI